MIARQVFGLLFVLHFVNINLEYLKMDKNIDKVMHAYNSNVLEQIRVTSS